MSEHRLHSGELLNARGVLSESGYAVSAVKNYDRRDIKSSFLKIKEWDYYLIYNEDYGIAFTIFDGSYVGLICVSILDFIHKSQKTKTETVKCTFGRFHMPSSPDIGDIHYENETTKVHCLNDGKKRKVAIHMKDFYGEELNASFVMTSSVGEESIVTAIPFPKRKKEFSYQLKTIGLNVTGYATCGERIYSFHEDSKAIFHWSRGVWPYQVNWYWGAASGTSCDQNIGINIGNGSGNVEHGSENAFFVNGRLHKIEQISCDIKKSIKEGKEVIDQVIFVSKDQKLHAIFIPFLDYKISQKRCFLFSKQHQIFGQYRGSYTISSEETIVFDHIIGFFQEVTNKW